MRREGAHASARGALLTERYGASHHSSHNLPFTSLLTITPQQAEDPRRSSILAHLLCAIRFTVLLACLIVEMVATCAACMWVICVSPTSSDVCPYACSVIHITTRVVCLICARLQYGAHTHSTSLATTYSCRSVTVFASEDTYSGTGGYIFQSHRITKKFVSSRAYLHTDLQIKCSGSESKHLQEVTTLSLLCQVNSIFSLHSFR